MSEMITKVPSPAEAPFKCRICFADEVNFFSLDDLLIVPPNCQVVVAKALSHVTNEPLEYINNPLLPSRLCQNCIAQLQESYLFNLSFATSKHVWNEYLIGLQNANNRVKLQKIPKMEETQIECDEYKEVTIFEEEFDCDTKEHSKTNSDLSKPAINVMMESVKMHPCPLCTNSFTALDLKIHIKAHDSLNSYLTAPGIPKFTKKVKFFAVRDPDFKPLLSRTIPVLHKCIYCTDRFTATDLRDHIDQHLKDGNVTCDICSRQFHDLKALRTHRVKHIKQHPFECAQCGKGFLVKKNYDCHLLLHKNMLLHKCEECPREFSNPEHLKRHKRRVHGVGRKPRRFPFKCKKCLCRYPTCSKLDQHQCKPLTGSENLRLTKNKQKIHKILCQYCGKYVWNASAHMARHTGEDSEIHARLKSKKVNSYYRKEVCPICGKAVWNTQRKIHMHRHTGQPSEKCSVCGKMFWRKEQLKTHFRVHTGEKPFKCRFCGMPFNRRNNLKVHERIHIGVKAHACDICGKPFYEKSYLKKHMLTHRDKILNPLEILHFNVVSP